MLSSSTFYGGIEDATSNVNIECTYTEDATSNVNIECTSNVHIECTE